MTSYRIVHIMPDQSRATAAAGVADLDRARELAAVLMPPIGYLRPEAVEIVPGSGQLVTGTAEVLDWADLGPAVAVGVVTDRGGIDWAIATTSTRGGTALEVIGGIAPGHGEALALFDLREAS